MDHLIDEGVNPRNILYVSFDNPIVKLVNVESVLCDNSGKNFINEGLKDAQNNDLYDFDEIFVELESRYKSERL